MEWKFLTEVENKKGGTGLEKKMSSVWDSDFKVPVGQQILVGVWNWPVCNHWQ